MQTITATSKTGTEFTLTDERANITAKANGVDLGGMALIDGQGIEARFSSRLGGKNVKVAAYFDDVEWAKVKALFDAAEAARKAHAAALDTYENRREQVLRGMGQIR